MTTNNSINRRTDLLNVSPSGTGAGETGEVRFQELAANGTNYVALKAADSTATQTYTLPDAYPASNGQVLSAQTDGTMSWAAAAEGGVSGPETTTQDALVRWDGTDGTAVADSGVTLDNSGNMAGIASISSGASVTVEADSLDIVNGNDSTSAAELRLYEADDNGSNYIGVKTPASLASSYTYILPSAYPSSSGQVLSSNTSGTMSWVTAGGGGGGSDEWVIVDTATLSNDTSWDIMLDITNYKRLRIIAGDSVTNIDRMRVYSNGAEDWVTTGSYRRRTLTSNDSTSWTSNSNITNDFAFAATFINNRALFQYSAFLIPQDSTRIDLILGWYVDNVTRLVHHTTGTPSISGGIGGLRFYNGGSNLTGTYTLEGVEV